MAIDILDKAQETYQVKMDAEVAKQKSIQAIDNGALDFSCKTRQRDMFERSDPNKYFTGYDTMSVEEINSLRYRSEHTIVRTATWFSQEVGKDLQEIKEEKGEYNGSDLLNSYGSTYARLYAEIEQRYENDDAQWFGLGGEPLTKEKEIEELNRAYDSAAVWAAECAEVMADIQNMEYTSLLDPAQGNDRSAPEVLKPEKKDLDEMKRSFYEARDKYMELYGECKLTGKQLTRQSYIFGHNALLGLLARSWSEDPQR